MALGAPQIATVGAITQPTDGVVSVTVGSELAPTNTTIMADWGLFHPQEAPELRSTLFAHGAHHMRHTTGGTSYRVGLLAPQAGQTTASTAVRATVVLTFNASPNDGDVITIGDSAGKPLGAYSLTFKTTLTLGVVNEVLIGANQDAALTNLVAFINGTGTNGSTYWLGYVTGLGGAYDPEYWQNDIGIEVSASDTGANTVTFRAVSYGTIGNTYVSTESTSAARLSFASSTFTGGTSGSGTDPADGTYNHAYQHLRSGDGALSGRSALTAIDVGVNANINQTAYVDADDRDGATHFRSLRSTNGQSTLLYPLADTAIATAEPYVDSYSDDTIEDRVPYDPREHRLYEAGYPTTHRYVARLKGETWMGGAHIAADYTTGTASVTENAYTATLSAAATPKEDWIGRHLTVASATVSYLIVDVAEATRVLTFSTPYAGSTDASASYTVSDKRDPFALDFSVASKPNNWPSRNNLAGIYSSDPRGLTGLASAWDSIVAFTWTGLWRVYSSPGALPRLQHIGESAGSYSGHGVLNVDGVLMWIGPDGIHSWNGAGDPQSLSDPRSGVGDAVLGIKRTLARINEDEAEGIVGTYDTASGLAIWLVPLDGDTRNNHAIVFNTQSGEFSLWRVPAFSYIASLPGLAGASVLVAGDYFGNLYQMEVSTSDGVYAVEPVQTLSTYTASTRTLALSGSPGMPTSSNGLSGASVVVVDANGDIQIGKVDTNTAANVVLVQPLASSPSGTTKVILGGIVMDVQTSRYDWEEPQSFKGLVATTVTFQPQTLGRLYVGAGVDNDDPALSTNRSLATTDYADLSASDGEHRFAHKTDRGRRLVQRFLAIAPGFDVVVPGFVSHAWLRD